MTTKSREDEYTVQAEHEPLSGEELVEAFEEQENINRYEGPQGVKNLEKLLHAIGYDNPWNGDTIRHFLEDNPGAVEALRNWVAENLDHVSEWREALEGEVDMEDDEG